MTAGPAPPPTPRPLADVDWTPAGVPRSRRYDDPYHMANGLAEKRWVFLDGTGLPGRFASGGDVCVMELGFGTGLNMLAAVELWRRTAPAGARLRMTSVEGFPLSRRDLSHALALWPELSAPAAPLIATWDPAAGAVRVDWPAPASLTVLMAEAAGAVAAIDGEADAWFLDGFAPRRNPEMWRPDLMRAVLARTRPGGVAATYTAAGAVRRALAAAGFAVERRPGFDRKRHMTIARRPA